MLPKNKFKVTGPSHFRYMIDERQTRTAEVPDEQHKHCIMLQFSKSDRSGRSEGVGEDVEKVTHFCRSKRDRTL